MNLQKIREILEAELLVAPADMAVEVEMCCGADLMSDVLTFTKPNSLLLTGLTNVQVIYTAKIANIAAICLVRGKKPSEDVLSLARAKKIPLLSTALPMFESCGRLYKSGLPGCSERKEEQPAQGYDVRVVR